MREIWEGDTFTINGTEMRIIKIDRGEVYIKEPHSGKRYTYGLDAFNRIGMREGFKIGT